MCECKAFGPHRLPEDVPYWHLHVEIQRRTTYKVSFLGERVPPDLRFRGPLEAISFVRGRKIDPPGAPGRVFDLKCRSCGYVRRCTTTDSRCAAARVGTPVCSTVGRRAPTRRGFRVVQLLVLCPRSRRLARSLLRACCKRRKFGRCRVHMVP